MDRLHVAKKEQLLAERKRRNQILVCKIHMLNLIAWNHYLRQSTLKAPYFDDISSSFFAKGSSKSNLLNVWCFLDGSFSLGKICKSEHLIQEE